MVKNFLKLLCTYMLLIFITSPHSGDPNRENARTGTAGPAFGQDGYARIAKCRKNNGQSAAASEPLEGLPHPLHNKQNAAHAA